MLEHIDYRVEDDRSSTNSVDTAGGGAGYMKL